jgi:hypothetical protein
VHLFYLLIVSLPKLKTFTFEFMVKVWVIFLNLQHLNKLVGCLSMSIICIYFWCVHCNYIDMYIYICSCVFACMYT